MRLDFRIIFIEEFQNEERYVVRIKPDAVEKLAPDHRKAIVEEIYVTLFEIVDKAPDGERAGGIEGSEAFDHEIDHGKESVAVYLVVGADLFHSLVAESHADAETGHDLNQLVFLGDEGYHFIVGREISWS